MTTLLFNERTERIEVMHRFFVHDAETLLDEILGPGADIIDSSADQWRFGVYVHDRFLLYTDTAVPVALTLKGVELDGDYLWVYQAAPIPEPEPGGLLVEALALRDLWKEQVNTVNIEHQGQVQTLIFSSGTQRLGVSFR